MGGVRRLLQLLGDWQDYGSIIVFVNKQIEADELFTELLKVGKCEGREALPSRAKFCR